MGIELMPDGKTFKKLNATQYKALERYYKRLHAKPITQELGLPIGLAVLGVIGAMAYILKDKLKIPEFDIPDTKTLVEGAGGAVADAVVNLGDAIFPANPVTPEYITFPDREPIGPLSRCKRWETDASAWLEKVQAGDYNTIQAALAAKRIISNMKKEGCSRPSAFTVAQWKD